MNGIDAAATAMTAAARARAETAGRGALQRRIATEIAPSATTAIATAVPWPGSLIAIPLTTRMAASPIGPASQLSLGSPQSERIACPTTNEAAQMTARDA